MTWLRRDISCASHERSGSVCSKPFRKALKDLAEEAEKSSIWFLIKRKDMCWGTT